MADTKKYLDYAGLSHYDEKIKELIKAGDTAAAAQALADAKAYTDSKIGTLDAGVATVAAAIAGEKALREAADAAIEAKIGVASKAAVGTEGEEGYEAAVVATGLTKRIEDIEAAVGEGGSVSSQIEDAIDDLDLANTYAAKSYEGVVDTLVGDDADKSVRKIANEELAKQLIPESAKESLDTLAEIAAWIQAHPDDASAMNASITALQSAVGKEAVAEKQQLSGYVWKNDDSQFISIEQYNALDEDEKANYLPDYETVPSQDATGLIKRIADLESANINADTYTAIDNDEIDALFATT